jgi:hypothetical protein
MKRGKQNEYGSIVVRQSLGTIMNGNGKNFINVSAGKPGGVGVMIDQWTVTVTVTSDRLSVTSYQ